MPDKVNQISEAIQTTAQSIGVSSNKADQLSALFQPMVEAVSQLEERYNTIVANQQITPEVTKAARQLRLDIAKVRVETEKVRKSEKEEFLRAGKAIDGVANILKFAVQDKENALKDIENHFALVEQQRIDRLHKARLLLIDQLWGEGSNISVYAEVVVDPASSTQNFGTMPDDIFDSYLLGLKTKISAAQLHEKEESERIEKERKAEEMRQKNLEKKRLADKKKLEAENIRLRQESQERERLQKVEEAKREKEFAAQRAKEAKLQAALKAERQEKEAKEAELKAQRDKAAADEAKKEADRLAKSEESARQASLPDKEQLSLLLDHVFTYTSAIPTNLVDNKLRGIQVLFLEELRNLIQEYKNQILNR